MTCSANEDRRGYLGDVWLIEPGCSVELLAPVAETFTGSIRVLAHGGALGLLGFEASSVDASAPARYG